MSPECFLAAYIAICGADCSVFAGMDSGKVKETAEQTKGVR